VDPVAHVALLLAVVLLASKLGSELATLAKQPPVLGELCAGILLGNLPGKPLGDLGSDASLDMLSRIGALLLLFEVGLESTVREVLAVGASAAGVAVIGTIGSFGAGVGAALWLAPERGVPGAIFLGAAITATSIGITARVFKDLGLSRSKEARTILGAAVLDDIIGLVVLALATAWLSSGPAAGASPSAVAWLVGKTVLFLAGAVVVGVWVTPRLFKSASKLRTRGTLLALGLSFCFALSWAASAMGLAPIVGAFAAGLVLEDLHSAPFVARGEPALAQRVEPISEFLVPVFFVVMGVRSDVRAFLDPRTLALAGALTAAAILGKVACGFAASKGVSRVAVAVGMIPRGEVVLVFASLGASLLVGGKPVVDARAYSALMIVVLLTTLVTPPLLKWSFARAKRGGRRRAEEPARAAPPQKIA
jgi:Kef-type K+ transport system membrane component KefB